MVQLVLYNAAPEILRCDLETRNRLRAEGEAGYGHEIDCWAIGVLAYECLTGRTPRDEGGSMQQSLESMHTRMSKDAADFIVGCLQFEPTSRLTAREMLSHPWIVHHHPHVPRAASTSSLARAARTAFLFDSARDELHLDMTGPCTAGPTTTTSPPTSGYDLEALRLTLRPPPLAAPRYSPGHAPAAASRRRRRDSPPRGRRRSGDAFERCCWGRKQNRRNTTDRLRRRRRPKEPGSHE